MIAHTILYLAFFTPKYYIFRTSFLLVVKVLTHSVIFLTAAKNATVVS